MEIEAVKGSANETHCQLCAQISQDIICDACKARVQAEAFENKMKLEKEGRVGKEGS
jgi:hypothetical protein